ncbi:hypothetical protein C8F01DRAFT_1207108 [Mycena amicta]|nr:hypothetical protein C8F01DRAFT_1207108 [Mycena amicta]
MLPNRSKDVSTTDRTHQKSPQRPIQLEDSEDSEPEGMVDDAGLPELPVFEPLENAEPEDVTPIPPPIPPYCEWCGPGDDMCTKYGEPHLSRALAFTGANTRFRRVLLKAQSGARVKIGILGGSVTKGHGVSALQQWPSLYGHWWRDTFPDAEIVVLNGAVPATTSDYYAACFLEHIDEDVDLVVLEMAINDQRHELVAQTFELLLRSLLELPQKPAVLHLQIMALSFNAITLGGDLQTALAMYYDTPIISVRNFLLPHILYHHANAAALSGSKEPHTPGEDYWFVHNRNGEVDLRHMNAAAHALMSDMLSIFSRKAYCSLLREDSHRHDRALLQPNLSHLPSDEVLDYIPRLRLFDKYTSSGSTPHTRPACLSSTSSKHPHALFDAVIPSQTTGWAVWAPTEYPEKVYLRATEPGARAAFALPVGEGGMKVLKVTYLKSKTLGMGSVLCWIDEQRNRGARMDGWWDVDNLNSPGSTMVATNLGAGHHTLHCELLQETKDPSGGHDFRIMAVVGA